MNEFFENLKNGQQVKTSDRNVVAIIESVKDGIIEGRVRIRNKFFRASWDLKGRIRKNLFGIEYNLESECY